ncbi:MAG TPA: hypothetical protein VMU51_29420, partial [Mycobacteriales bacterium]|nr:hypothetical protein [Mycobacteriales bacterium]
MTDRPDTAAPEVGGDRPTAGDEAVSEVTAAGDEAVSEVTAVGDDAASSITLVGEEGTRAATVAGEDGPALAWQADQERITHEYSHRLLAAERRGQAVAAVREEAGSAVNNGLLSFNEARNRPLSDAEVAAAGEAVLGRLDHEVTMAIGDGRDLVGARQPGAVRELESRLRAWRDALPELVQTELSRHYGTDEIRQAFDRQLAEVNRPRQELLGSADPGVSDWVRERAYQDFSKQVNAAWRDATGAVPDGPERVREGAPWDELLTGEARGVPRLLERYQRDELVDQQIGAEFDAVWRGHDFAGRGFESGAAPETEVRFVVRRGQLSAYSGGRPEPAETGAASRDFQPEQPLPPDVVAVRTKAEALFRSRLVDDWHARFDGRPEGGDFVESFGEHLSVADGLIDHVAAREQAVHEAWPRLADDFSRWSLGGGEMSRGDFERVQEEFADRLRGEYDAAHLGPGSRPAESGPQWPAGPEADFRMRLEMAAAGLPDRFDLEAGMSGALRDGGRRFEALYTEAGVEVAENVVAGLGQRFRRDWGTAYHEAHRSQWAEIEDLQGWFEQEAGADNWFDFGRQEQRSSDEVPPPVARARLRELWRSLMDREATAGADVAPAAGASLQPPESSVAAQPADRLQLREHEPLSTSDDVRPATLETRYRSRLNYENQLGSAVNDGERAFTRTVDALRADGAEIPVAAADAARGEFLQRVRTAAGEALRPLATGEPGAPLAAAWQDWRQRSADLLATVPDLLTEHSRQSAALAAANDRFDAAVHAYNAGHDTALPAAVADEVRARFTQRATSAYGTAEWDTMADRLGPMFRAEAELRQGLQDAAGRLLVRPDPTADPAGVLAHAQARSWQQFETTYRAEFHRRLGMWLSDPDTSPAWLERRTADWQTVGPELVRAQLARTNLLATGWADASEQFDAAAATWQAAQPADQRLPEQSLLAARVRVQATVAGLHRQVWGNDTAFDHGRPGELAQGSWQRGLQSLTEGIPGGLEIRRHLDTGLRQADAALAENVRDRQAGGLPDETLARLRRQVHDELQAGAERTWAHLRNPHDRSPGADAGATWSRLQRQLIDALPTRIEQESALLRELARAAGDYQRLAADSGSALPADTRARLADEYRAHRLADHLARHPVDHSADATAWLAAEQAHENTFGVRLGWATLLQQYRDHRDQQAPAATARDLPAVEVALRLRLRTGAGTETTIAALVDPATGRTFLAVDEGRPGRELRQSVLPGVDGTYLRLLGQGRTLTGRAAASTARRLARTLAPRDGQSDRQPRGVTQVFPGRSDSHARVGEVTGALPRLAGVNLLAVHLTPDGYAEIDRDRLSAETAQIVDQAAGHGRPQLTAEEFAAAAVRLPGFDPSLPVVVVGCPAGSRFTAAFERALADLTAPAGGQRTTRELWTAGQYAWQTSDGRVLAASLGVSADGRAQVVRGPDDQWIRHRRETSDAGSGVTRTQHGPDLMTALVDAVPDLRVDQWPGRLTSDHRWSGNPADEADPELGSESEQQDSSRPSTPRPQAIMPILNGLRLDDHGALVGADAVVGRVRGHGPAPDLVLLDLEVPEEDADRLEGAIDLLAENLGVRIGVPEAGQTMRVDPHLGPLAWQAAADGGGQPGGWLFRGRDERFATDPDGRAIPIFADQDELPWVLRESGAVLLSGEPSFGELHDRIRTPAEIAVLDLPVGSDGRVQLTYQDRLTRPLGPRTLAEVLRFRGVRDVVLLVRPQEDGAPIDEAHLHLVADVNDLTIWYPAAGAVVEVDDDVDRGLNLRAVHPDPGGSDWRMIRPPRLGQDPHRLVLDDGRLAPERIVATFPAGSASVHAPWADDYQQMPAVEGLSTWHLDVDDRGAPVFATVTGRHDPADGELATHLRRPDAADLRLIAQRTPYLTELITRLVQDSTADVYLEPPGVRSRFDAAAGDVVLDTPPGARHEWDRFAGQAAGRRVPARFRTDDTGRLVPAAGPVLRAFAGGAITTAFDRFRHMASTLDGLRTRDDVFPLLLPAVDGRFVDERAVGEAAERAIPELVEALRAAGLRGQAIALMVDQLVDPEQVQLLADRSGSYVYTGRTDDVTTVNGVLALRPSTTEQDVDWVETAPRGPVPDSGVEPARMVTDWFRSRLWPFAEPFAEPLPDVPARRFFAGPIPPEQLSALRRIVPPLPGVGQLILPVLDGQPALPAEQTLRPVDAAAFADWLRAAGWSGGALQILPLDTLGPDAGAWFRSLREELAPEPSWLFVAGGRWRDAAEREPDPVGVRVPGDAPWATFGPTAAPPYVPDVFGRLRRPDDPVVVVTEAGLVFAATPEDVPAAAALRRHAGRVIVTLPADERGGHSIPLTDGRRVPTDANVVDALIRRYVFAVPRSLPPVRVVVLHTEPAPATRRPRRFEVPVNVQDPYRGRWLAVYPAEDARTEIDAGGQLVVRRQGSSSAVPVWEATDSWGSPRQPGTATDGRLWLADEIRLAWTGPFWAPVLELEVGPEGPAVRLAAGGSLPVPARNLIGVLAGGVEYIGPPPVIVVERPPEAEARLQPWLAEAAEAAGHYLVVPAPGHRVVRESGPNRSGLRSVALPGTDHTGDAWQFVAPPGLPAGMTYTPIVDWDDSGELRGRQEDPATVSLPGLAYLAGYDERVAGIATSARSWLAERLLDRPPAIVASLRPSAAGVFISTLPGARPATAGEIADWLRRRGWEPGQLVVFAWHGSDTGVRTIGQDLALLTEVVRQLGTVGALPSGPARRYGGDWVVEDPMTGQPRDWVLVDPLGLTENGPGHPRYGTNPQGRLVPVDDRPAVVLLGNGVASVDRATLLRGGYQQMQASRADRVYDLWLGMGADGTPTVWTMETEERAATPDEVLEMIAARTAPVDPGETDRPPRVWTGQIVRMLVDSPQDRSAYGRFMRWVRRLRELSVPVVGRAMEVYVPQRGATWALALEETDEDFQLLITTRWPRGAPEGQPTPEWRRAVWDARFDAGRPPPLLASIDGVLREPQHEVVAAIDAGISLAPGTDEGPPQIREYPGLLVVNVDVADDGAILLAYPGGVTDAELVPLVRAISPFLRPGNAIQIAGADSERFLADQPLEPDAYIRFAELMQALADVLGADVYIPPDGAHPVHLAQAATTVAMRGSRPVPWRRLAAPGAGPPAFVSNQRGALVPITQTRFESWAEAWQQVGVRAEDVYAQPFGHGAARGVALLPSRPGEPWVPWTSPGQFVAVVGAERDEVILWVPRRAATDPLPAPASTEFDDFLSASDQRLRAGLEVRSHRADELAVRLSRPTGQPSEAAVAAEAARAARAAEAAEAAARQELGQLLGESWQISSALSRRDRPWPEFIRVSPSMLLDVLRRHGYGADVPIVLAAGGLAFDRRVDIVPPASTFPGELARLAGQPVSAPTAPIDWPAAADAPPLAAPDPTQPRPNLPLRANAYESDSRGSRGRWIVFDVEQPPAYEPEETQPPAAPQAPMPRPFSPPPSPPGWVTAPMWPDEPAQAVFAEMAQAWEAVAPGETAARSPEPRMRQTTGAPPVHQPPHPTVVSRPGAVLSVSRRMLQWFDELRPALQSQPGALLAVLPVAADGQLGLAVHFGPGPDQTVVAPVPLELVAAELARALADPVVGDDVVGDDVGGDGRRRAPILVVPAYLPGVGHRGHAELEPSVMLVAQLMGRDLRLLPEPPGAGQLVAVDGGLGLVHPVDDDDSFISAVLASSLLQLPDSAPLAGQAAILTPADVRELAGAAFREDPELSGPYTGGSAIAAVIGELTDSDIWLWMTPSDRNVPGVDRDELIRRRRTTLQGLLERGLRWYQLDHAFHTANRPAMVLVTAELRAGQLAGQLPDLAEMRARAIERPELMDTPFAEAVPEMMLALALRQPVTVLEPGRPPQRFGRGTDGPPLYVLRLLDEGPRYAALQLPTHAPQTEPRGMTLVFPGRSDSDARVGEVTGALPRIAGVNLLAVHVTPDGHAEVDRGRLPAGTARTIDQVTGHDRQQLTAEEFAAAVVRQPGFDPSLPVVVVGCPAGSRFTVAFGRELARLTTPATGQPATRELWTAERYAWQTRDGRVLAASFGLTADGRPQLDASADGQWVRYRLDTTGTGSRVTRTEHGPDLMTALVDTVADLRVDQWPGRLTSDHRWSGNPADEADPELWWYPEEQEPPDTPAPPVIVAVLTGLHLDEHGDLVGAGDVADALSAQDPAPDLVLVDLQVPASEADRLQGAIGRLADDLGVRIGAPEAGQTVRIDPDLGPVAWHESTDGGGRPGRWAFTGGDRAVSTDPDGRALPIDPGENQSPWQIRFTRPAAPGLGLDMVSGTPSFGELHDAVRPAPRTAVFDLPVGSDGRVQLLYRDGVARPLGPHTLIELLRFSSDAIRSVVLLVRPQEGGAGIDEDHLRRLADVVDAEIWFPDAGAAVSVVDGHLQAVPGSGDRNWRMIPPSRSEERPPQLVVAADGQLIRDRIVTPFPAGIASRREPRTDHYERMPVFDGLQTWHLNVDDRGAPVFATRTGHNDPADGDLEAYLRQPDAPDLRLVARRTPYLTDLITRLLQDSGADVYLEPPDAQAEFAPPVSDIVVADPQTGARRAWDRFAGQAGHQVPARFATDDDGRLAPTGGPVLRAFAGGVVATAFREFSRIAGTLRGVRARDDVFPLVLSAVAGRLAYQSANGEVREWPPADVAATLRAAGLRGQAIALITDRPVNREQVQELADASGSYVYTGLADDLLVVDGDLALLRPANGEHVDWPETAPHGPVPDSAAEPARMATDWLHNRLWPFAEPFAEARPDVPARGMFAGPIPDEQLLALRRIVPPLPGAGQVILPVLDGQPTVTPEDFARWLRAAGWSGEALQILPLDTLGPNVGDWFGALRERLDSESAWLFVASGPWRAVAEPGPDPVGVRVAGSEPWARFGPEAEPPYVSDMFGRLRRPDDPVVVVTEAGLVFAATPEDVQAPSALRRHDGRVVVTLPVDDMGELRVPLTDGHRVRPDVNMIDATIRRYLIGASQALPPARVVVLHTEPVPVTNHWSFFMSADGLVRDSGTWVAVFPTEGGWTEIDGSRELVVRGPAPDVPTWQATAANATLSRRPGTATGGRLWFIDEVLLDRAGPAEAPVLELEVGPEGPAVRLVAGGSLPVAARTTVEILTGGRPYEGPPLVLAFERRPEAEARLGPWLAEAAEATGHYLVVPAPGHGVIRETGQDRTEYRSVPLAEALPAGDAWQLVAPPVLPPGATYLPVVGWDDTGRLVPRPEDPGAVSLPGLAYLAQYRDTVAALPQFLYSWNRSRLPDPLPAIVALLEPSPDGVLISTLPGARAATAAEIAGWLRRRGWQPGQVVQFGWYRPDLGADTAATEWTPQQDRALAADVVRLLGAVGALPTAPLRLHGGAWMVQDMTTGEPRDWVLIDPHGLADHGDGDGPAYRTDPQGRLLPVDDRPAVVLLGDGVASVARATLVAGEYPQLQASRDDGVYNLWLGMGLDGIPTVWTMAAGERAATPDEVLEMITRRTVPAEPDGTDQPPPVWTGQIVRMLVDTPRDEPAYRRFRQWVRQLEELSGPVAGRAMEVYAPERGAGWRMTAAPTRGASRRAPVTRWLADAPEGLPGPEWVQGDREAGVDAGRPPSLIVSVNGMLQEPNHEIVSVIDGGIRLARTTNWMSPQIRGYPGLLVVDASVAANGAIALAYPAGPVPVGLVPLVRAIAPFLRRGNAIQIAAASSQQFRWGDPLEPAAYFRFAELMQALADALGADVYIPPAGARPVHLSQAETTAAIRDSRPVPWRRLTGPGAGPAAFVTNSSGALVPAAQARFESWEEAWQQGGVRPEDVYAQPFGHGPARGVALLPSRPGEPWVEWSAPGRFVAVVGAERDEVLLWVPRRAAADPLPASGGEEFVDFLGASDDRLRAGLEVRSQRAGELASRLFRPTDRPIDAADAAARQELGRLLGESWQISSALRRRDRPRQEFIRVSPSMLLDVLRRQGYGADVPIVLAGGGLAFDDLVDRIPPATTFPGELARLAGQPVSAPTAPIDWVEAGSQPHPSETEPAPELPLRANAFDSDAPESHPGRWIVFDVEQPPAYEPEETQPPALPPAPAVIQLPPMPSLFSPPQSPLGWVDAPMWPDEPAPAAFAELAPAAFAEPAQAGEAGAPGQTAARSPEPDLRQAAGAPPPAYQPPRPVVVSRPGTVLSVPRRMLQWFDELQPALHGQPGALLAVLPVAADGQLGLAFPFGPGPEQTVVAPVPLDLVAAVLGRALADPAVGDDGTSPIQVVPAYLPGVGRQSHGELEASVLAVARQLGRDLRLLPEQPRPGQLVAVDGGLGLVHDVARDGAGFVAALLASRALQRPDSALARRAGSPAAGLRDWSAAVVREDRAATASPGTRRCTGRPPAALR